MVRPFQIAIPAAEVAELRRRIRNTRWPVAMAGAGWSMGIDLNYLCPLCEFWCERFEWDSIERQLNAYPQFIADTTIGPIHLVWLRSQARRRLPLILTHGWPSTFAELLPLARRLMQQDGQDSEAGFDLVIPSLPGYGFSPAPRSLGTNAWLIADAWVELMHELGYDRFIAHGGDIGAAVSTAIAVRHPASLQGLHLNYIPGSYEPYLDSSSQLSLEEREFLSRRGEWADAEGAYAHIQATKPDTLSPALNDSPVGLAAWIVEKFRTWSDCGGDVERRFSKSELLTTVSIYWFTQSMPSAIRLYWEARRAPLRFTAGQKVNVPTAIARFPRELPVPPRSYVDRGYNVTRWTEYSSGGHFAGAEEPQLLAADIRAFAGELALSA